MNQDGPANTSAATPDLPVVGLEFSGSVVAPFYWVMRGADGKDRFKSGTITFVDTGSKTFGVTACHVVDACLNDQRSPEFVQCMIGGNGETLYFRLDDRLIERNSEMDLATILVTQDEVTKLGCFAIQGLQSGWPPTPPQSECAATLCGFPGKSRVALAQRENLWGRVGIGADISASNETLIRVLVEREKMYRCLGEGSLGKNHDFGGMSGGSIIALVERAGLTGWMPAGIIIDGPNPGDNPAQDAIDGLEIFSARPVQFVKADGKLDVDLWNDRNPLP